MILATFLGLIVSVLPLGERRNTALTELPKDTALHFRPCPDDDLCFEYDRVEGEARLQYMYYGILEGKVLNIIKYYNPRGMNLTNEPNWSSVKETYHYLGSVLEKNGWVKKIDTVISKGKYSSCGEEYECGYEYQAIVSGDLQIYRKYVKGDNVAVLLIDVGPIYNKDVRFYDVNWVKEHVMATIEYRYMPMYKKFAERMENNVFE